MLRSLSIRDIAHIGRLDISFCPGLNVLTGETGAGKSILLDALGLALGGRTGTNAARGNLLRRGAKAGSASALFSLGDTPSIAPLLAGAGIDAHNGELLLRRRISADGRSRAFVNDVAVGVALLREIGRALVEMHGQRDDRILTDPNGHRRLLDTFAGAEAMREKVMQTWARLSECTARRKEAERAADSEARDRDYLTHALAELDALAPEAGEDTRLDGERRLLRIGQKIGEEMAAIVDLAGARGAEGMLAQALRRLERIAPAAEGRLDEARSLLEQGFNLVAEAAQGIEGAQDALSYDEDALEALEERLFALRALARKHRVAPDALPDLRGELAGKLDQIAGGAVHIASLRQKEVRAEDSWLQAALQLHEARKAASARLDEAMARELPPLRLSHARFHTHVAKREPAEGGGEGISDVRFAIATNPADAPGPLDRVASGGELSRLLLALKSVLVRSGDSVTMIFDEIDRGIGGATADAVGARLRSLGRERQLLVITHSPQVAARGDHHWRVSRSEKRGIGVDRLTGAARLEELARMLSGARITRAARAAAKSLLG